MGGFYGSVQFRATDRALVMPAIEAVARARGARFLVGPPLDGWVGAYPSDGGQDESLAHELVSQWPGELLYLAVHDDDILLYRYFREGSLVDAYWSAPGYFDEGDRDEQEAQAGHPERYAHLVRGGLDEVRAVLARDGDVPTFEVERLESFAALLGIRNAVTSYEYLDDGELDDIVGFAEFVRVPDPKRERDAAKAAKKALRAELTRLKKAGVLLGEAEVKSARLAVSIDLPDGPVSIALPEYTERFEHSSGEITILRQQDALRLEHRDGSPARRLTVGTGGLRDGDDEVMKLFRKGQLITDAPIGKALGMLLRHVSPGRRQAAEHHLRCVLPKKPWTLEQTQCLVQLAASFIRPGLTVTDVSFTRHGEWLVVGTDMGLRVADWSDVMAAETGTPVPWRWTFDVPPTALDPNPRHGYVYAVVHDAARARLIFGGMDGRLRTMALADGHVDTLWDLPGRPSIVELALLDGRRLVTWSSPPRGRGKSPPVTVHVWSLDALDTRPERPLEPAPPAHALDPVEPDDSPEESPFAPVVQHLTMVHSLSAPHLELRAVDRRHTSEARFEERLVAPLLAAGFQRGEAWLVPALGTSYVQFLVHPEERIAATLQQPYGEPTILTLSADAEDGTAFVVTNARDHGLDAPPGRTIFHRERADAESLLRVFRAERPAKRWVALALEELPARFVRSYEQQRAWRLARGFTEDEAARYVTLHERRVAAARSAR